MKDTSILHMLGLVDFVDQLVTLYEVCSIRSIHIPLIVTSLDGLLAN